MLVLTRKLQEQIRIGENITLTILRIKGKTIRVGIEAPRDVRIVRCELKERIGVEAGEAPLAAKVKGRGKGCATNEVRSLSQTESFSSPLRQPSSSPAGGREASATGQPSARAADWSGSMRRTPGADWIGSEREARRLGSAVFQQEFRG